MHNEPSAGGSSASGLGIRLIDFRSQHLSAVHNFAADPLVCRYSTWGPNQLADTQKFLADALIEQPHRRLRAIMLGDVLIGSASVWATERNAKAGELGYTLNREYWGNGYATAAVGHLLRLGFEDLGLERISATCDARNAASIRVLEKSGFKLEERRAEDPENSKGRVETLVFGLRRT